MSIGEPSVSVITPFYNTAPYLAECIESVLNQTYQHFEYVLVNNRSTDGSGDIAETYSRQDSRIRLIHADVFRTQIQNYNFAIEQASKTSRYIKFALGDDWLYPGSLAELVALAETNPRIGLVSAYELRGAEVFGTGLPAHVTTVPGREAGRLYFFDRLYLFGSPTTVLYRGDIVRARTPFFSDALHEDTEAVFHILAEHDFGFVHQVLCFIRTQDDSLTGRLRDLAEVALDRLIILKRFGRKYLNESEYRRCMETTLAWYYHDLGSHWISQWMGKRNDEFWTFHRQHLGTIGERLHWNRVVRATVGILVDNALNPGRLVRKLKART
jgi:glycosyltransferase involved in cell wall biosynthesis